MNIKLNDTLPEGKYKLICACQDCGKVLDDTCELSGAELRNLWTGLVVSAPLNTGSCPNGCRATYSDCNANTELRIVDARPTNHDGEMI